MSGNEFWIEDFERDEGDLVLFVSCFGRRRAQHLGEAIIGIERVSVTKTEFVEVIEQECDDDGGVTHDDHYIVTARVKDGAVDEWAVDNEYDRVHDALTSRLQRAA